MAQNSGLDGTLARDVYAKADFLGIGIGIGYAHSLGERFGLRADISSMGSQSRKGSWGNMRCHAMPWHAMPCQGTGQSDRLHDGCGNRRAAQKIKDKADDFKILPQIYLGVSYRF